MSCPLSIQTVLVNESGFDAASADYDFVIQPGADAAEDQQFWIYFLAEIGDAGTLDVSLLNLPQPAAPPLSILEQGGVISEMTQVTTDGVGDGVYELKYLEICGPRVRVHVEASAPNLAANVCVLLCSNRPFTVSPIA